MDKDGYPTEEELQTIKTWDLSKNDVHKFFLYLQENWWMADWGFKIDESDEEYITIEMHTGGWSGNEDVIQALKEHFIFWSMYWHTHTRGGHYYFQIKRKL